MKYFYCPQTKLREGNVFTGISLSVILSGVGGWVDHHIKYIMR